MRNRLQGIMEQNRVDFVIANGENAAGGSGVTPAVFRELISTGINVVTTGNHIWSNKDIHEIIESEKALLRPANYPAGVRGYGYNIFTVKGISICVINLMGRVNVLSIDCPFRKFDEIYREVQNKADIVIVDFHAEATSEKRAMGWYLDGRASLVFGTHTHVQTADEEILPGGTGYITDLGMTGPFDSVIGMDKTESIERFLTQIKPRFKVATGQSRINGIIADISRDGMTINIQRINT